MAAPPARSRPVSAAVATEALTTRIRRYPLPELGPDDGLLRVEAAAVCGTDWEIYRRRGRDADLGPLILGHENVGRITAIGARAAERWGVEAGDRIAVEQYLPCGTCRMCRGGDYRLCPDTDSYGGRPVPRYGATPVDVEPSLFGGFAEYLYLHPRSIVHRVGEDIAPELATLFVPLANGIRWVVREGGLTVGQTLVVIGPGRHGLGCVVAAREAGAGLIVVVGTPHDRRRLAVARALGADRVLESGKDDPVAAVRELTGGVGADLVVDLAPGAASTVEDAIAMCAPRAKVMLAASKNGKPVSGFQHDLAVRKELVLRGVRGHDHRSVEPALDLIRSGRHRLGMLCTHRFPLEAAHAALLTAGTGAAAGAIHVSVIPAPRTTAARTTAARKTVRQTSGETV